MPHQKSIPANKVRVYVAGSVEEFCKKLPKRVRKALEANVAMRPLEPVSTPEAVVEPEAVEVVATSQLPTDPVAFPKLQVVVDMQTIVDRERFAA